MNHSLYNNASREDELLWVMLNILVVKLCVALQKKRHLSSG